MFIAFQFYQMFRDGGIVSSEFIYITVTRLLVVLCNFQFLRDLIMRMHEEYAMVH